MLVARSGRSDITQIVSKGEHIDLDIQEHVRQQVFFYLIPRSNIMHVTIT